MRLRGSERAYCLATTNIVDDRDVISAAMTPELNQNQPSITLVFSPEGSRKLREATTRLAADRRTAGVVIGDRLVMVMLVFEALDRQMVMTGSFDAQEGRNWVTTLSKQIRQRDKSKRQDGLKPQS